jgi:hypothetical protein
LKGLEENEGEIHVAQDGNMGHIIMKGLKTGENTCFKKNAFRNAEDQLS